MHVPRRFILGLVCGVVAAIGFFVALLYATQGPATNSSSWAYDIMQKKAALAAATPGPRLLIVGGSGTTFGLNAQRIEEQTGCHTLNMGTHAGLGLDYILYWAQKVARPGDKILLVTEYELYTSSISAEQRDDYILAHDPAYFRQMSLWDKISMATRIPFKRIQKGYANRKHPEKPPRPHPPYTDGASYLTNYGDETGNPEALRPTPGASMELQADLLVNGITSDTDAGFNRIRVFVKWAKAHQITVLATFPNIIHRPEYDGPNADSAIKTITDFYTSLGVPVVGTAREAMLPKDQFFDTVYHLTHEAAVKRTDRLVPELRPYLNTAK
jgi:hypothetical protein